MAARTHPDVEYSVEDGSGKERIFKTFNEAAGFAVGMAASGTECDLDVLIWSVTVITRDDALDAVEASMKHDNFFPNTYYVDRIDGDGNTIESRV